MTIEFTSLAMTDFRTRPGEILDRVSDKGEAFVIERNGRQSACLVPLSLFLPDIAPARVADELHELENAGETPRTTVTADREIAFEFLRGDAGAYDITVVLPHRYPNACPRVYASPIDSNAPHRFADGALCIFGVMSSWNPGKHTASLALKNARQWLQHYDEWRSSAEWPKPGLNDVR